MLSTIWTLSALCAVALSSPVLNFSPGAAERPAEMKILSQYFSMLGQKVQEGKNMAQAPVCNLNNAVLPVTCEYSESHRSLHGHKSNYYSSNPSTSGFRRTYFEACGDRKRDTELFLHNKCHSCTRLHRSTSNTLQCNLHCLHLPRPTGTAPKRSTTIQPHIR
jgi:hypothetical protein